MVASIGRRQSARSSCVDSRSVGVAASTWKQRPGHHKPIGWTSSWCGNPVSGCSTTTSSEVAQFVFRVDRTRHLNGLLTAGIRPSSPAAHPPRVCPPSIHPPRERHRRARVTEEGFERAPLLSCSCLTSRLLSLTPLLSVDYRSPTSIITSLNPKQKSRLDRASAGLAAPS